MNPNWHEADQLAIYKRSRVVEPKTTWNKSKAGLELGISRFQVQHPNAASIQIQYFKWVVKC